MLRYSIQKKTHYKYVKYIVYQSETIEQESYISDFVYLLEQFISITLSIETQTILLYKHEMRAMVNNVNSKHHVKPEHCMKRLKIRSFSSHIQFKKS